MFGTLFSGCSQSQQIAKEKIPLEDSLYSELKKYPTTTHFIYEIMNNSTRNFYNIDTLEKIISNVEKQFPKKDNFSEKEITDVFKATDKEIKIQGLEPKENKFDCDDFSFIYLAVGEKLNIPLYAVPAPAHIFIRYDKDGKHNSLNSKDPVNEGDFNWETTGDFSFSDSSFIDDEKIPKELIKKGIFMKNLTKLELIAQAYFNKGVSLNHLGKYNLAIENYDLAIELNPNDADFYCNKKIAENRLNSLNK